MMCSHGHSNTHDQCISNGKNTMPAPHSSVPVMLPKVTQGLLPRHSAAANVTSLSLRVGCSVDFEVGDVGQQVAAGCGGGGLGHQAPAQQPQLQTQPTAAGTTGCTVG